MRADCPAPGLHPATRQLVRSSPCVSSNRRLGVLFALLALLGTPLLANAQILPARTSTTDAGGGTEALGPSSDEQAPSASSASAAAPSRKEVGKWAMESP